MSRPAILLHGGAGIWKAPRKRIEKALKDIEAAREHGWRYLHTGSALEAVVEAISYMEDSGSFNAGTGSVLNIAKYREMDAGLMDGSRLRVGAVAAVKYPKNPIRLAKIVLEKTDHVLLAGNGADQLAEKMGLDRINEPNDRLFKRYHELLDKYWSGEWRIFARNKNLLEELGLTGTVGAVALDNDGRLAAGVSTGGVWLKLPGRVGDSSIPGAGFYADKYVAVAATGIGEVIVQSLPGIRIALLVSQGYSLKKSVDLVLDWITSIWGKDNTGLIAIDHRGEYAISFNTRHIMVSYKDLEKSFTELLSRED